VTVTLKLNGAILFRVPGLPNGSVEIPLPPWVQLPDTLELSAEDAAGNVRRKARTRRQLVDQFGDRVRTSFEPR